MKTTQQTTEELARKCASEFFLEGYTRSGVSTRVTEIIRSTIPLVELLEVVRAAKARLECKPLSAVDLDKCLTNLRNKGIEI